MHRSRKQNVWVKHTEDYTEHRGFLSNVQKFGYIHFRSQKIIPWRVISDWVLGHKTVREDFGAYDADLSEGYVGKLTVKCSLKLSI